MNKGPCSKILVVDDEAVIVKLVTTLFVRAGYQVQSASDGVAALQAVGEFQPDVVILDVMMPKENGYRVSRKIKMLGTIGGLEKVPKILIVTARDLSHDQEREEATNAYSKADSVMYKPFRPADLMEKVTVILRA